MTSEELTIIANRWEGVSKGYQNIKFEEAHADMLALLAEVRSKNELAYQVKSLEGQVIKRNNDVLAFVCEVGALATKKCGQTPNADVTALLSEVNRLAHQKYGDWSSVTKT